MDDINPRQFASLDYSNADMYSGLNQRPPTATPLNLPLEDLAKKTPSTNQSSLEQAYNRDEKIRTQSLFKEQQEAQALFELALRDREIARNLALQQTRNNPLEQPEVSSRDYEAKFKVPPGIDAQQSTPSTSSPAPTTRGTAARASALVEPTAHPAPVGLAEIIPPAAGAGVLAALPRGLPQAAGRLAVPGVVGGIDFANRLVQGQSVQHAATSAIAAQVGFVGGFAIGSAIGGPLLGYAAGAVGGLVAGAIADSFFHPPPTTGSVPSTVPQYFIMGGQSPGVQYRITGRNLRIPDGETTTNNFTLWGPISGPNFSTTTTGINKYEYNGYDAYGAAASVVVAQNFNKYNVVTDSITRIDGTPDTGLLTTPAPPPDNLPYQYNASPIGDDNTVPSGTPEAGKNKGKTRNVAPSLPSNNTPNGAPFFPGHGGLGPSYTPNPTQTPSNLGAMLPAVTPVKQSLPFAEPDNIPITRSFEVSNPFGTSTNQAGSGEHFPVATFPNPPTFPIANVRYDSQGNVLPTDINGNKPFEFTPTPLEANPIQPNALPTSNPVIFRAEPTPDAQSPTPKTNSTPKPETSEQNTTKKQTETNNAIQKKIQDELEKISGLATIIAALTPAIQGIPDAIANSPTIQAANKQTTQNAVCEIAQPGKCLGKAIDDSANKINQNNNQNTANILDKINAGANAAQIALLELINTKLGDLLPNGGISAFLKNFFDGFNKLAEWLHLDRALNILTFVMTVQNVYFLCDSLKVVTLQMISDMLAVVGIMDKDNNPLNLNEILGHEVEELLKSILGEEELAGFKKEWKALNRIYQAATNTLFAIQNMVFSILQALEIIGSWNASIGNALKKYLVVGQHAFNWMNPNPNFHNNFFKFLGEALNVVTSLDFVAQSILQGRQAIDDFGKQTDELTKGISEASDGFKPPEHKATAEAATNSANVSKSPTPSTEEVQSIQD